MTVYRVEVRPRAAGGGNGNDRPVLSALREAGLAGVAAVASSRLFFLEGQLDRGEVQRLAVELLTDPVTEAAEIVAAGGPVPVAAAGQVAVEVHPRPGVMDPVAESTLEIGRAHV